MVINWTNTAIKDLKEFKEYTKLSNANDYIVNLVNTVNLLVEKPKLGKIYIYTNNHIVRQLIHSEHKIFYYIDNDIIHIISVVHHKQDMKRKIQFIKKYFK